MSFSMPAPCVWHDVAPMLPSTLKVELQADKALKMAEQTNSLKAAGRAARNRANLFYEWDISIVVLLIINVRASVYEKLTMPWPRCVPLVHPGVWVVESNCPLPW
jgi:hypothetical protein